MLNPEINIEKFINFHKKRIILLRKLLEEKSSDEKLLFQICFLGIESLAKLLFKDENSSKKRFIKMLSNTLPEHESQELYNFWRCPLVHEGFITKPWTTLEAWDDQNNFIFFSDKLRSSTEYSAGSIIEIYNNLINYVKKLFEENNIEKIILH